MDAIVCVVWSVSLLTNIPSLKAESSASVPASTTVSPNEAIDLFVNSKITDPKEQIRMDLARLPPAPKISSSASTDGDREGGAAITSLYPFLTMNQMNTKVSDTDTDKPSTDATVGTDIIHPPESSILITSPKMSTNTTLGSLDITPSLIPLTSTTITPGSTILLATKFSEEHQNSSQSTTSETIPTGSLIPPSIPASSLKDLINGSASLAKENQEEPSELDVGDEESDELPSPSPLDPLLAGLISIFITSTALLSVLLFLKFRQQSNHPEFHRLQDLPMDDLLEDTPLSRYSH